MATWNVRTLYRPGALRELTNALTEYNISIAAVQETRWTKETPTTFRSRQFNIYTSSNRSTHEFGTAFLVERTVDSVVLNFIPIDERLCVLRIKGRFFNYSLINVHAPTNDASDDIKEEFYEKLREAYRKCPKHDAKIIMGDLNAKLGREEEFRPTIGRWSLHANTNENGFRLLDFATEMGLSVVSTRFRHKNIHLATWESPDRVTKNQIDHCIIDIRHASDVINVRTCRGANVDSDHHMVLIVVRARISRANVRRFGAMKRFALDKLKDPEVSQTFAANISTRIQQELQNNHHESIPQWSQWGELVKEEAANTLGYQSARNRDSWFDEECATAIAVKNEARLRKFRARTREEKRTAERDYAAERKSVRKLFRQKRRNYQDRTLSDLERLHSTHQARKFYKQLNSSRKGFNPQVNVIRARTGDLIVRKELVLERWREHFDLLLNGSVDPCPGTQDFLVDDGMEIEPPTLQDVNDALKRLKNNKSPGPDGIPAELLKHAGSEVAKVLHRIVLSVWSSEVLPIEWMEGALIPLHKKGDKLLCENYRGITLLNTAYKVLAWILYRKLTPYADSVVGEYQCGFRKDRSTADQIFNVRLILQRGREFNIHTHHLFIDFKAAYDSVKRVELYKVMHELAFPSKLIRLVAATLDGPTCRIKMQNDLSEPFVTLDGLRQGDALSTLLFNVALEGAIRRTNIRSSGTLANSLVQILAFADDIDIVGRTEASVNETYLELKFEAAKVGLEINETKTKFMTTDNPGGHRQVHQIGDQNFEVVDHFVYLGASIRADGDTSAEIKRRIMLANRCYYGLQKHLRSRQLFKNTKCTIYKTLIRPVLTYGCESWPLTRSDENMLLRFERKVLRAIFGAKQENGAFRRRYNFELDQDYAEPNIISVVKASRLSWAGHLARMEPQRIPATLFRNNPQGRRGVGRPKMRWIDGVEQDLKTLQVRNWREKALDRQTWFSIINQARAKKWQ